MNFLVSEEYVSEISCGRDFSYILKNSLPLSLTEYKVLQNQKDSFFIKCVQAKCNGECQLYYLTGDYKPLESMLPGIDAASFITIVSNLFSNILELKNNGFLSCQNVIASLDKIYVDPGTLRVYLVYVPAERHLYNDLIEFENEIRTRLLRVISGPATLDSMEIRRLFECLSDTTQGLADIQKLLGERSVFTEQRSGHMNLEQSMSASSRKSSMRLLSINMPIAEEISIKKDSFVIGKKQGYVDAVINFNPMISRRHCRITCLDGAYYISDMGSSNGTYVNGKRLAPDILEKLENGDIIRLANAEFRAIIEWSVL